MAKPRLPALQFIRSKLSEGAGPTQTYREYAATVKANDWRGMRAQDFYRLYHETRNVRESVRETMSSPPNTVPSRIEKRGTITARGFGQWVGIHQRTRGEQDYIFTPFLVKTAKPITPAEAEARAAEWLEQQPDEYNRVVLGVGYLTTEQFIPGYRYDE